MLSTHQAHTIFANQDKSIFQLIDYAKQTLTSKLLPFRLRASSYLRLVCLAKQKISLPETVTKAQLTAHFHAHYSSLYTALVACDAMWWQQCSVSQMGTLRASNSNIDVLLQPLDWFVQSIEIQRQAAIAQDDSIIPSANQSVVHDKPRA